MEKADLLLRGAIDMHAHGYPQFTLNMPPRVNNLEWAQAALDATVARGNRVLREFEKATKG